MPEQISKYPDVTLEVLKGAGAVCGEGAPQQILTQCPAARFCALSSGEICVYGIDEIAQMTQITPREIARVVGVAPAPDTAAAPVTAAVEGAVLGAVFVGGIALGRIWTRRRVSGPPAKR